jgi:hypothetical protein
MKFIIITFSFLLILFSCNTIVDKPLALPANELAQQFKPFLRGVWVQSDYMDDILKTRSPVKSSEKLTFITQLTIDTSGISADSMNAGIALGNHEGSDIVLYFKQGQTPTSLFTNINGFEQESGSYELDYEISGNDTALTIYHYDSKQKLLDKTKYIKEAEVSTGGTLEDGFQYMGSKKLIAGSYIVTDSTGIERSVRMNSDGVISGLPGLRTYYVITDFIAAPEDNTDKICFDIQTDLQRCYAFEIIGNTISLFKAREDETDTLFNKGPALYKFVKQL